MSMLCQGGIRNAALLSSLMCSLIKMLRTYRSERHVRLLNWCLDVQRQQFYSTLEHLSCLSYRHVGWIFTQQQLTWKDYTNTIIPWMVRPPRWEQIFFCVEHSVASLLHFNWTALRTERLRFKTSEKKHAHLSSIGTDGKSTVEELHKRTWARNKELQGNNIRRWLRKTFTL